MPIEFHRDGPWNLPEGWVWARLGDACHINRPPSFDRLPDNFEVPFIPMSAVAEETGRVDLSERRRVAELRSGYTRFQSGDVLFAKITPCMENGKTVPLPELPGGYGAGSTEFHTLRSHALDARYLWYWLVRKKFRVEAQRNMRGAVGQLRVPLGYLRDAQVAVPPLPEQRRIVARIDELLTEIADGETALERVESDLETWRHALLKAAVTGELTREWRETQRPNATGADVLASAAELKAKFGVRSNYGRRLRNEDATSPDELPEVPPGWIWAKLSDFAYTSSYGTSTKCAYDGTGICVLRIPNIRAGHIELTDIKKTVKPLRLSEKEFLEPGDLLIVRTNGSEDLIGRAAMVTDKLVDQFYFASYLIRFRIVANNALRRWIALYLESPVARAWVRKNIASSAGQYNISQSALMRMPIPVPPESEMNAGAELFRRLDSARGDVARNAEEADAASLSLRESILRTAFEGALVAQCPDDEPADRMLSRLNDEQDYSRAACRSSRTVITAE
jgi:type I restriction enzyme, S subunit